MKTLISLLIGCVLVVSAFGQYGGGAGTAEDPYLIFTAEQMNEIGAHAEDFDKHFKLMADIDLADYAPNQFNVIGHFPYFTGVFDGNDHSISNFHYAYSDRGMLQPGLFYIVSDPNAEIKNLELIDPNVNGISGVGPLVGILHAGSITNCHVRGGYVNIDGPHLTFGLGGLVGWVWTGTITGSTSSCSVTGYDSVGGLVGCADDCVIQDCCASGEVTGEMSVGGLVGGFVDGSILRSCATGSVVGRFGVGGLVGRASDQIADCYATGGVAGEFWCGGLVGSYWADSIANCYATGEVIMLPDTADTWARHTIGGLVGITETEADASFWDMETTGWATSNGGIGLTTAEMQTAATFLEAGWDFIGEEENGTDDVWWIDEGQGYPRLWWERSE